MALLGLPLPGDKGYEGWYMEVRGARIPHEVFIGDVVDFLIVALVGCVQRRLA